jgi:hypothetical protein
MESALVRLKSGPILLSPNAVLAYVIEMFKTRLDAGKLISS